MEDLLVRLRPFRESDLELLTRFATDPSFSVPFQWAGFRSPEGFRRRWEEDGLLSKDPHYLVVEQADEKSVGWVIWREAHPGQGGVWEVGIHLAPEHRGQGVGTAAQRLLVDHLFNTTSAHRLCACTELENLAEQRALEKCGFCREGVLREANFVRGGWRDVVVYGRLRGDNAAPVN